VKLIIVNLASGDLDSSIFFIKMDSYVLVFPKINYGPEHTDDAEQEADRAIMVLTV
jgi:hypothetical protein